MNRRAIIFGFVIVLIFAMIAGVFFVRVRPENAGENALTPQAQTQRLTSVFLLRKIERLRDQAVYLQHKEEGGKLLELAGRGKAAAKTASGESIVNSIDN